MAKTNIKTYRTYLQSKIYWTSWQRNYRWEKASRNFEKKPSRKESILANFKLTRDLRVMIDVESISLIEGSSHRRKGAARHIIDMVWLYRSPIPVGRRGIFSYLFKLFLPAFAVHTGRGGSQHPLRKILKSWKTYLEKRLLLLHVLLEFLVLEVQGLLECLQPAGPVLPLCLNLRQPDHLRLKMDSFTRRKICLLMVPSQVISRQLTWFIAFPLRPLLTIDFRVMAFRKNFHLKSLAEGMWKSLLIFWISVIEDR